MLIPGAGSIKIRMDSLIPETLVTGATGFVGKALITDLLSNTV